MTTTKSYSERSRFGSLYRTALKQRIPFGIIAFILFGLVIALPYFIVLSYQGLPYLYGTTEQVRSNFSSGVYIANEGQSIPILLFMIMLALVGALTQSSYLHSKSRTDFYHALPAKRPTLLSAHALAYLTVTFIPFLAIYILTMMAQLLQFGRYLMGYAWYFQFIAIDLLCVLVTFAAVYAFTTFISVNVGTTFDGFALTGVLGALPTMFSGIVLAVWESMTYGASNVFTHRILMISPFTFPFLRYSYLYDYSWSINGAGPLQRFLILLLVWLAISAGIYAAAIWSYNRRKSELAEQTQPGGIFQTIAKCFTAFCGGAMFYAIFFEHSFPVRLIAVLCGALIIGLIAELILSRGIRALVKNLKWLAMSGALFCFVIIGVSTDITGYVSRVPNPQDVESVEINYRGRFEELSDSNRYAAPILTDPDAIAIVAGMHQMAVENRPPDHNRVRAYNAEDYQGSWTTLTYKLKNGSTLTRSYNSIWNEAYRKLSELESNEDFIRQHHAVFFISKIADSKAEDAELVSMVSVSDSIGGNSKPYNLSKADNARLLEAVRADMLSESLQEIRYPSESALGYLKFQFIIKPVSVSGETGLPAAYPENLTGTVVLTKEYQKTLAVMRTLGIAETLETTPFADEILLQPAWYGYTNGNHRVCAVTDYYHKNYYSHYYDSSSADQAGTTDPTEIRTVMAAARNQMFRSEKNNYDAFFVLYYLNREEVGMQIIRYEDLPDSMQAQVRSLYLSEYDAFGINHEIAYEIDLVDSGTTVSIGVI